MSGTLAVLLSLGIFLSLILAGMPIALSLAGGGFMGIVMLEGLGPATASLGDIPYSSTTNYSLVLIPMFILLGVVVAESGIAAEVFRAASRMVGRLPGGLAMTTVLACTFFGGISGSSAADVATLGRISVAEMTRHGYQPAYAAAVVASASTVAILIPPSIALVIYGVITQEPIGELLVAGIVPGVLTALIYCSVILIGARKPGFGGRAVRDDEIAQELAADRNPDTALDPSRPWWIGIAYAMALFGIVMGGIYTGQFTATESAAVGALAAIVLAVLVAPHRRRTARKLPAAVLETVAISAMIFAIIIGGSIFNYFLTTAGVPADFAAWVSGLPVSPKLVVLLLVLVMIPLGMILDGLSLLLIVVPVAYPVVEALGFDGVWFGILVVCAIEVGLVTPPVGMNVFVIAGVDRSIKVESIFRSVTPFVLANFVAIAIFYLFPDLILWLPGLMGD